MPQDAVVLAPTSAAVMQASVLSLKVAKELHRYDAFTPEIQDSSRARIVIEYLHTVAHPDLFPARIVFDGTSIWSIGRLFYGASSMKFEIPMSGNTQSIHFHLTGDSTDVISIVEAILEGGEHPRQAEMINILRVLVSQRPIRELEQEHAVQVDELTTRSHVEGETLENEVACNEGPLQLTQPTIEGTATEDTVAENTTPGDKAVEKTSTDVAVPRSLASRSPRHLHVWATQFLFPNQRELDIGRLCSLSERDERFKALRNALRGIWVHKDVPRLTKSMRPIRAIVPRGAHHEFELHGKRMTVTEYYLQKYGKRFEYPDAFGVVIRETPIRVVLPAEMCVIVSCQLLKKKAFRSRR
ncbi:hypothetical protein DENSPDRAFT_881754 [Dentipellis sp. KUC8613]|nr:hypothetical protein DENSPDRAFT_881754 [Dentipellis sp. KUC8613]